MYANCITPDRYEHGGGGNSGGGGNDSGGDSSVSGKAFNNSRLHGIINL